MIAAFLPLLGSVLGTAVKRIFPDPADDLKARELENQLRLAVIEQTGALERSAAEIIRAEAQSESWLARNWRPLVMLTFTALIVARWMGYSAPNISESEILALWDIVQLGLGGYAIGRSVEKVAPALADALNGKGKSRG
jgi:hypothetical protein